MTDTTLNRFMARGTNAQRLAFTPSIPSPASGPSQGYIWFEEDTGNFYAWNNTIPGWQFVASLNGAIILPMTASESLAAGAMVNIWNSSGAKMRNANATDNTKPCHGFVLAAVASSATGLFFGSGTINSGLSALTPGTTYYLDITNGAINATPPSVGGNLVQELGVALSATQLAFAPKSGITL